MKNLRSAAGLGLAAGLAVAAAIAGYSWFTSRLERSSRDYVDEAVPQIVGSWSDDELLNRASDSFRSSVDVQQLQFGFSVLERRLGALVSYEGSKGGVHRTDDKPVTATYDARGRFERGEATIRITLLRVDGDWRILGFSIDSPALSGNAPAPVLKPFEPGSS